MTTGQCRGHRAPARGAGIGDAGCDEGHGGARAAPLRDRENRSTGLARRDRADAGVPGSAEPGTNGGSLPGSIPLLSPRFSPLGAGGPRRPLRRRSQSEPLVPLPVPGPFPVPFSERQSISCSDTLRGRGSMAGTPPPPPAPPPAGGTGQDQAPGGTGRDEAPIRSEPPVDKRGRCPARGGPRAGGGGGGEGSPGGAGGRGGGANSGSPGRGGTGGAMESTGSGVREYRAAAGVPGGSGSLVAGAAGSGLEAPDDGDCRHRGVCHRLPPAAPGRPGRTGGPELLTAPKLHDPAPSPSRLLPRPRPAAAAAAVGVTPQRWSLSSPAAPPSLVAPRPPEPRRDRVPL